MHGLILRSIQNFVVHAFGREVWQAICVEAEIGHDDFEALLTYELEVAEAVVAAACERLDRTRDDFLEDVGTDLVAHPDSDSLRRLLRFGGDSFEDFLHSLEDMHDRVKLALPDMDLPYLELREHGGQNFSLRYRWDVPGFGALALGILRAMADEYGVLVLLERQAGKCEDGDIDTITIAVLDRSFADGRTFDLGVPH